MRGVILLITIATLMLATMLQSAMAFADSCFSDYAHLPGAGPGSKVSGAAIALSGVPPGNEHIAQDAQKLRQAVPEC
jgi:hypothetical protein